MKFLDECKIYLRSGNGGLAARAGFMPSRDDEGRLCGVQSRDPSLAARLAKARWGLTDVSDDSDGY